MNQPRNSGGSIRKALAVLQHVGETTGSSSGCSLTGLANALGYDKSTVLRVCAPLVDSGLLQRDAATGLFQLGPATLRLGQNYLDGLDLRNTANPHLSRLLAATGCTCHLVVREGLDVVYIDKRENTAVVRMASRIGYRLPLHCTAGGKSILAFGPEDVVEEVIAAGPQPLTARTIVDPVLLRDELAATRRRGYGIDNGENEPGVRCVAAPVLDHTGAVAGAVSVSDLATQMTAARVRELGGVVRGVAEAISLSMGSPHGQPSPQTSTARHRTASTPAQGPADPLEPDRLVPKKRSSRPPLPTSL